VKTIGVIRGGGEGVDGGVQEADRGTAGGDGLLIDERGEAGPERRGATSAAEETGAAIVINDFNGIGGQGDIGKFR